MRKSKVRSAIGLFSAAVIFVSAWGTGLGAGSELGIVKADNSSRVSFMQGTGGEDATPFNATNNDWVIKTIWDSNANPLFANESSGKFNAAIVENNHGQNEPIIRLVNGVENETIDSKISDYRAGTAFYKNRFALNATDGFSAKFTFSMPDAWVCANQTKDDSGNDFSREIGGDGIAFVITSKEANAVVGQAGGGIGYQNVDNSIIVELDSFYNGAYATSSKDSTGYINWGYDNQLYLNKSGNYFSALKDKWDNLAVATYKDYITNGFDWKDMMWVDGTEYGQLTPDPSQRFDHVGITLNGDPKNHVAISYLAGNDPTKLNDDSTAYVNLTGNISGNAETRFTDENVDNRLFTVWVDYKDNKMEVRYALGDYNNAVRPENADLTYDNLNATKLKEIFGSETPEVCIGFTSAIGSSKANHTIHSVYFSNYEAADYAVNYWVECDAPSGDYDASLYYNDTTSNKWYQKVSVGTAPAENTDATCSYEGTAAVGDTIIPATLNKDSYTDYELKYSKIDSGAMNSCSSEGSATGTVTENGLTINLYYQKETKTNTATYTIKHWKEYNPNTYTPATGTSTKKDDTTGKSYYLAETENKNANIGTTITPNEIKTKDYTGYKDGAIENFTQKTVLGDGSTNVDVYYDLETVTTAEKVYYKVTYYKLDPNTEKYVPAEIGPVTEGTLKDTVSIDKVDPTYESKYTNDNYTVNKTKNEDYSVTLSEPGKTYDIAVYYDPPKVTYQTEYYLKQDDGTYKKVETVGEEAYTGKTVTANEKTYDGYTHVTTDGSVETDTVKADGSTTLKVYYDPNTKSSEDTEEEDTDEEDDADEEEEEDTEETTANKPKTGDAMNVTFLIIVMLATGTTGVICLYFRKKEDE